MHQRRTSRLRPITAPITPDLAKQKPITELEALRTQNNYATYLLKQERRRHAVVEGTFIHALDELQKQVDDLRAVYITSLAKALTERKPQ